MKQVHRSHYIIAAAVLVVLAGCGLWWTQVRQAPNRVFWDMLANNLSTNGVTRTVVQQGQGLSVSQYTQLSFGQPSVHALTVFAENGNTLTTEEISNPGNDYVRYQRIQVPQKGGKTLNTSAVLGKWARLQSGQTVSGQLSSGLFGQSLIDVLPIANLTPTERATLLKTMRQQSVFTYDTSTVKKQNMQGRPMYVYAVSINPAAYIRLMQQFESLIGGTAYASLKPASAAHAKPIAVTIAVDARSHELSALDELSAGRIEQYQGFGITDTTPLPTASITTTQLTQRLGQLLK